MEGRTKSLEINFVYGLDHEQVNEFLSCTPKNAACINYIDIYNKLAKNDFYNHEPSNEVVTSYLIKQLREIFKSNISSLYYTIETLDSDTINNIKKYITSIANREVIFNVYQLTDKILTVDECNVYNKKLDY